MSKGLKTVLIVLAVIAGLAFIIFGWLSSNYNRLVDNQVEVETQWSNVETQYQRRADLIPDLVATVRGAAGFEQETIVAVTEARTNWLNAAGGDRESTIQAAQGLDSALSRLLVSVENYPTLTATDNFQTLQAQLEGTENRISVARQNFNEAAGTYNRIVRRFPSNIIAGLFNFEEETQFEAQSGAENSPEVNFDEFTDTSNAIQPVSQ